MQSRQIPQKNRLKGIPGAFLVLNEGKVSFSETPEGINLETIEQILGKDWQILMRYTRGIAADVGWAFLCMDQFDIKTPVFDPQATLVRPSDGLVIFGPVVICKTVGSRLIALEESDVQLLRQALLILGWKI